MFHNIEKQRDCHQESVPYSSTLKKTIEIVYFSRSHFLEDLKNWNIHFIILMQIWVTARKNKHKYKHSSTVYQSSTSLERFGLDYHPWNIAKTDRWIMKSPFEMPSFHGQSVTFRDSFSLNFDGDSCSIFNTELVFTVEVVRHQYVLEIDFLIQQSSTK